MRKSSARVQQADLFDESGEASRGSEAIPESDVNSSEPASSAPLRMPSFGVSNELYADAARRAGRLNAANVPEEEYQALLQERQRLLDKKFEGSLTRSESNRLEYVRWSLDRIEDAKHGASLDALEGTVGKFERFLSEVQDLKDQLAQRSRGTRK